MKLHIVVHSWSGDKVPVYHMHLRHQLNSLITFPFQADVSVTVVTTEDDQRTNAVVAQAVEEAGTSRLTVNTLHLPLPQVINRAIGRNVVAKGLQNADWVWFADADYMLGDGCVDSLVTSLRHCDTIGMWPNDCFISLTHDLGDEYNESAMRHPWGGLLIPDMGWSIKRNKFAIGGIQIVRGDWAREHGYLARSKKRQRPSQDDRMTTPEDVAFRKQVGNWSGGAVKNLYRIRHVWAGGTGGEVDRGEATRGKEN